MKHTTFQFRQAAVGDLYPIKVRNWARYASRCDAHVSSLLEQFLGHALDPSSAAVSLIDRADVFRAFGQDPAKGIIAAIVWGYPSGSFPGGRGFDLIFSCLSDIASSIERLQSKPRLASATICARFEPFERLGPSTFTKLLYFAGIEAEEGRCLIYDQMVMRSIALSARLEWLPISAQLGGVYNAAGRYRVFSQTQQLETYGAYLRTAAQIAGTSDLADSVERALFAGAPRGRIRSRPSASDNLISSDMV